MNGNGEFTSRQRLIANFLLTVCFLVVGGSAAVTSFTHIRHYALLEHQAEFMSLLYPLIVDGLMGAGSIYAWHDSVRGMKTRGWARLAFWFGLLASVCANVMSHVSAWGWGIGGVVVAGFPALALLVMIEMTMHPSSRRKVARIVAKVEHTAGRLAEQARAAVQPPADVPQAPTAPAEPAASRDPEQSSVAPVPRRGRPEDDEPLSPELVALALQVGTAWRERTGREATRKQLRTALIEAGWRRGISNVTAGRLMDLIRNHNNGDQDQAAAEVQAVSEDQGVREDLATANGRI